MAIYKAPAEPAARGAPWIMGALKRTEYKNPLWALSDYIQLF